MGILFLSHECAQLRTRKFKMSQFLLRDMALSPVVWEGHTGLRVQRNTSAKFGRREDGTIHLVQGWRQADKLEVGVTEDKWQNTTVFSMYSHQMQKKSTYKELRCPQSICLWIRIWNEKGQATLPSSIFHINRFSKKYLPGSHTIYGTVYTNIAV